ncbi:ParB family protein [Stenotrophomonas maltophilia]|uniref:ParB family protein n=1 Tax=Stenotrophomonas maltophilia TaxID=40324 RepID=UPI001E2C7F15|nr:ParB family protein [Stenotrophomonas maltophilia]MCD5963322.1 ParB family protein [Stenotrophomonas maltophilia]
MAEPTPQDMAAKLLAKGFERNGPSAAVLTDPIADTPMVVTLDQLRPYEHDPRVTRNPAYEEIKASIRERGLDAPPAITRRPGEAHYIIRNGGNTRLAILRELWSETKEDRFFRIACLFRPWPARGEIVALTGHLAENELRGGLTFIERALGIEKAREFYEQESGQSLSQSELARRLTADGYPVPQSHISRMNDAVRYLLPAIPNLLYGGLGRHQVERIAVLRKACERIWERRALNQSLAVDFATLFQDVLSQFDAQPEGFSPQRAQDELIGQMADMLGVDYDTLALEIDDSESRQRALTSEPAAPMPSAAPVVPAAPAAPASAPRQLPVSSVPRDTTPVSPAASVAPPPASPEAPQDQHGQRDERLQGHIVTPAPTTERLQSIQRMVADQLGDKLPEFEADALRAIPVQVGGLYPISDVWYVEPGLDAPDRLRVHIAQFAREIGEEAAVADHIEASDGGIGFVCVAPAVGQAKALPAFARAVLTLLHVLSAAPPAANGLDCARLADELAALLHGHGSSTTRLSDAALVKLFRLLRLARRLLDLEAGVAGHEA